MAGFKKSSKLAGFTLVELIVAMTLFSFMMLILSIGVLQIMKMYQADVASRKTQSSARLVVEEITRGVRDASRVVTATSGDLCVEGTQPVRFQLSGTDLLKTAGTGSCPSPSGTPIKLIDGSGPTQAREFTVQAINGADGITPVSVKIKITVTTGSGTLLNAQNICNPGASSQFCASTSYTNIISLER